jgi:hypothetical protein
MELSTSVLSSEGIRRFDPVLPGDPLHTRGEAPHFVKRHVIHPSRKEPNDLVGRRARMIRVPAFNADDLADA